MTNRRAVPHGARSIVRITRLEPACAVSSADRDRRLGEIRDEVTGVRGLGLRLRMKMHDGAVVIDTRWSVAELHGDARLSPDERWWAYGMPETTPMVSEQALYVSATPFRKDRRAVAETASLPRWRDNTSILSAELHLRTYADGARQRPGAVGAGGAHEDRGRYAEVERFDSTSGTFTVIGHVTHWRNWHSATVLPDGTVLVAGGSSLTGESTRSTRRREPLPQLAPWRQPEEAIRRHCFATVGS
jgi:hypothetical protein